MAKALDIDWELHGQHTRSASTRHYQYENLKAFFNDRLVDEINEEDVKSYRRKRERDGVKGNTINREHGLLTALFNRLRKWKRQKHVGEFFTADWILPEENPGPLVKKIDERLFTRTLVVDPTHFQKFLVCAHPTVRKICLMAILSLLRKIDLEFLNKGNVNFFTASVQGIQSKTQKPYHIPLLDEILDLVEETPVYRILDFTNFKKRFLKARADSNVYFQFRDLRRTGGNYMLLSGMNIRTIQKYFGHTTMKMTEEYLQPGDVQLHAAGKLVVEKISSGRI